VNPSTLEWYGKGNMLRIVVTGHPAEGKTTIAMIIEKALKDHGILVKNLDPDVVYGSSNPDLQSNRIETLRVRSRAENVHIETDQVHK